MRTINALYKRLAGVHLLLLLALLLLLPAITIAQELIYDPMRTDSHGDGLYDGWKYNPELEAPNECAAQGDNTPNVELLQGAEYSCRTSGTIYLTSNFRCRSDARVGLVANRIVARPGFAVSSDCKVRWVTPDQAQVFVRLNPPPEVSADFRYPDGVIGRRYSQEIILEEGTGHGTLRYRLAAGTLPDGLTFDGARGLIQGTPTVRGISNFTVEIEDQYGRKTSYTAAIKVYGVLTVGKDGTFNGCSGLQMSLNAVQDLDEIRIQRGIYNCTGNLLASNKSIPNGIKLSGGWDASFEQQQADPALTLFNSRYVEGISSEAECDTAGHIWEDGRCYLETAPASTSFFTFSSSGPVHLEALSFYYATARAVTFSGTESRIDRSVFVGNRGGDGGAVHFSGTGTVSNSLFENNGGARGGAVYLGGAGTISNSHFEGNSGSSSGGAIHIGGAGTVSNSHFKGSSGSSSGGAIYIGGTGTVSNSHFEGSRASSSSGAVYIRHGGTISDSHFEGNSASSSSTLSGGAVFFGSTGTVNNSYFIENSLSTVDANANGGAIYFSGTSAVSNSHFEGNSVSASHWTYSYAHGGAIIFSGTGTVSNSHFEGNSVSATTGTRFSRAAYSYGGALHFSNSGSVYHSIFSRNYAHSLGNSSSSSFGGAIYFYSSATVSSGHLNENSATSSGDNGRGGAIYYQSHDSRDTTQLIHSRLVANSATHGGAVYNVRSSTTMVGTLFDGNSASGVGGGGT